MRTLKDTIVRKRPRRPDPDAGQAPVRDFRELAKGRSATKAALSAAGSMRQSQEVDAQPAAIRDDQPGNRPAQVDVTASRAAPQDATPPARPKQNQIWDIERAEDAGGESRARTAAKERAAKAEEVLRQMQEQELEKENRSAEKLRQHVSKQSRAKTRILGFHNADLEPDVLAAPPAAPAGRGEFPAGWLIVVDGPGRGACFTVGTGVSSIGREEDQTICLAFGDGSISRQNHASVAYDEEQNRFFIGHGGKANLVRRNGTPVLTTEELFDSDHIRIGKTTLRFVALCGPDFVWGPDRDDDDEDAGNG